jgi:transcriptional regulator with XRE-family HTH domain
MEVQQRLGRAIRERRERAGLSQEGLADKAAIHRTYLSGVETGDRNPTVEVIARIAKALGIPIAALFREGGSE